MKAQLPTVGKVSPELFEEVILPHLGKRRKEVVVGPKSGVDVGAVDIGRGQVMVTTTDPIFVVPSYGWERSAWFAVHILASDAVTSGLAPQYITIDLNLPMSINRDQFELLWKVIHGECERIGMAIISGHTGPYEGCGFPMIGGATVIAIGSQDSYITPTMARPGDHVLITKGAAIEACGLFAVTVPKRIAADCGDTAAEDAEGFFWQMSVVDDALSAAEVGIRDNGVTAMHDAAEGGVWVALVDIAHASNVGMNIEKGEIIVQHVVGKICRLFDIDPYSSSSQGTLVITCRPNRSKVLLKHLNDKGIQTSIVGEIVDASNGIHYFEDGKKQPLVYPEVDPLWPALTKAAAES